MLVGIAILGVGGYLLYQNSRKKSFVGNSLGDRQRFMAGNYKKSATGTNTTDVKNSNWLKGQYLESKKVGKPAPPFFKIDESKWN
jgi:hypothetical protein